VPGRGWDGEGFMTRCGRRPAASESHTARNRGGEGEEEGEMVRFFYLIFL
jgi:hypothetical protein